VTPFIIVPGPWSEEDLRYHAENVASGLVQNTSHNCIAAEVGGGRGMGGMCVCVCGGGGRGEESGVITGPISVS
jgi:hypothetical protein